MKRSLSLILLVLCLSCPSLAAIPAGAIWECRTTGTTTGGAFFNPANSSPGTDYSVQDSPQISVTDAVANGTTTVTSATASFSSAVQGNGVYINGAWYEIVTYTNSTTIVVDRTIGSASGLTLKVGGAISYPGIVIGSNKMASGNTMWIKAGTYTLSASGFNANNASMDCTAAGITSSPYRPTRFVGYNATRGDNSATRPVFSVSGSPSATGAWIWDATDITLENIEVNTNAVTIKAFYLASARSTAIRCKVTNGGSGVSFDLNGANSKVIACEASGGGANGFALTNSGVQALYCEAHGQSTDAFATNASGTGVMLYGCLAYGVTGGSSDGFDFSSTAGSVLSVNCTSSGNAGQGFRTVTNQPYAQTFVNCLAVTNTGSGFGALLQNQKLLNCATYNNSAAYSGTDADVVGHVTLSGDPFTAAGSNDFSLNNTASAGAACRAAGFPAALLRGTTANYADIGAVQASVPAAPAVTRSYGAVH